MDTLTVSSSGPAATHLSSCMGEYRRVGGLMAEGRPVWRMGQTGDYFFYTSNGRWMIGPDYKKISGGMQSEERGLMDIPLTGWQWSAWKGTWTSDPKLTVVCE